MEFKQRLRQLRAEAGISGEELGQKIGIAKSSVSELENGVTSPKATTVSKLCDYFKVSADYIMGRSDIRDANAIINESLVAFYDSAKDLTEEQRNDALRYMDYLKNTKK